MKTVAYLFVLALIRFVGITLEFLKEKLKLVVGICSLAVLFIILPKRK